MMLKEPTEANKQRQVARKSVLVGLILLATVVVVVGVAKRNGVNGVTNKFLAVQAGSDSNCRSKCAKFPAKDRKMCLVECKKSGPGSNECATCRTDCSNRGGTKAACRKACKVVCPKGKNMGGDIVGGGSASKHEYPSVVSIQIKSSKFHFCGGTLVSDKDVLTAAHCCRGKSASSIRVVLGEHQLNVVDNANEQIRNVAKITMHPSYSSSTRRHDVCLLALSKKITLTSAVTFASLPPQGQSTAVGTSATVVGWGRTWYNQPGSQILKEAAVTTVSDATCDSKWGHPTYSDQICAFSSSSSACMGDSGGPLLRKSDNVQIGVVSWGSSRCYQSSAHPTVYAEVSAYRNWINSELTGSSCVSGDSMVRLKGGEEVRVGDVSIGDYVETVNGYEMVWYRESGLAKTAMKKLEAEHSCGNGGVRQVSISLTKEHMLFDENGNLKRADEFGVGDWMDVSAGDGRCSARIVKVSTDVAPAVSVVTYSGEFLLANGARVSSYSHSPRYAKVVHVLSFPFRWLSLLVGSNAGETALRFLSLPDAVRPGSAFAQALM